VIAPPKSESEVTCALALVLVAEAETVIDDEPMLAIEPSAG